MNLRPTFEADDDSDLREEFVRVFSEYASTQPVGGGESFGAFAVRTGMSLDVIFNRWKIERLAERTVDSAPVQDTSPAKGDFWNRPKLQRRAPNPAFWKS